MKRFSLTPLLHAACFSLVSLIFIYAKNDIYSITNIAGENAGEVSSRNIPDVKNGEGATALVAFDQNSPGKIYAVAEVGLLISDNAGLSWHASAANSFLKGSRISAIAVAVDGTVYLGSTEDKGSVLYKSTDHAASFLQLSDILSDNVTIHTIACHPLDAGKLVIAHSGGLSYTNDAGNSWNYCTAQYSLMNSFSADEAGFDKDGYLIVLYHNKSYRSVSVTDISGVVPVIAEGFSDGYTNSSARYGNGGFIQQQLEDTPIQEEIIAGIVVCPNPAHGSCDVILTLSRGTDVTIKLNTMSGLQVRNYGTVYRTGGTTNFTLDLTGISGGNYLMTFDINGTTTTKKLTIY